MPSIFSRRRGSTGQLQRQNAPVSSAATVAASAAFLNKSPSGASLSSAAAATALRSHTTTPEPIGNVQTKRMVRRGSQSSNGSNSVMSGTGAAGQRPVVRRSSQGSLTERTFRSPSPGGVSPRRAAVPAADDAPPVPALRPEHHGNGQQARPPSRESTNTPRSKPAPVKVYQPTGLPKLPELERGESRNSINFSRPIASPTETTPPVSPTRPKTAGSWFSAPAETKVAPRQSVHDRPRSAAGISPSTRTGIEANVQSVARTPSKKKQKAAGVNPGSKLAAGTLSKAPQGTAVQRTDAGTKQEPPSLASQQNKKQTSKQQPRTIEQKTSDAEVSHSDPLRQTPSPSGTRKTTHTLNKQPSVVMEEPESGQETERKRRSQDNPYPKLEPSKNRRSQDQHLTPRSREPSLTPSTSSTGSPPMRSRPISLEVPDHAHKSAHFSNSLVDTPSGVRHNPPNRSVSPAKSALKHSPSSSVRTSSPIATFSPATRPPGSDTSDSMSLTSQDGIKPKKRKKSVRVSFDESAIEHIHEIEEKPNLNGVQGARRSLSPGLSDEDMDDETMKPRPALPSFGSVRNSTPRRDQPDSPEKVTETLSDNGKPSSSSVEGVSSDHAIASVLVDAQVKKAFADHSDPLPPEVTSVEGSGHFSDSAESSDEEELIKSRPKDPDNKSQQSEPKRGTLTTPEPAVQRLEVPDIQVLPATPGIEDGPIIGESSTRSADDSTTKSAKGPSTESEELPSQEIKAIPSRVSIPGGWDDDEEEQIPEPVQNPIRESIAQPADGSAASTSPGEVPIPDEVVEQESDSDDSAAFSDAAEDPSELEPFGFASLDAIVETPVTDRSRKIEQAVSPTMSTPLLDSTPEIGTPATDDNDWSRASAYWSHQKQQLQRRESDQPIPTEEASRVQPAMTTKKSEKSRAKPVVENPADSTSAKPKARPSQQPGKQMRSSMRGPQPRAVEERSTTFRKTMRGPPPAPAPQPEVERNTAASKSALKQKTMRPASAGATSAPASRTPAKPAPAPVTSAGDSDSESSFRRKPRRGSANDAGRYTMKRSMRSSSLDMAQDRRPLSPQGIAGAGRWSLRSMSPPGDTPVSNKSAFRTSLRGTSIPEGPTLRGSNSIAQAKSSKSSSKFSMSGFSRGTKSPTPSPASAPSKKAFKSRFADSDSDDDGPSTAKAPMRGARTGFRSRYADSDDEDDQPRHIPADLTPVRGIPRPMNTVNEDSTDLDDSSDDDFSRRRRSKRDSGRPATKPVVPSQADIDKAMAAARQNVAAMTGNQALLEPSTPKGKVAKRVTVQTDHPSPAAAPSTSAAHTDTAPIARRKGLLGSLFGRRGSSSSISSTSKPAPQAAEMTPPASPSSPRGKLQRRHAPKLNRSSSAQSQLSTMSNATATTTPTAAMPAVKEDEESDVWPLEPPRMPIAIEESQRPASSDGVAESGRAKLGADRPKLERRSMSGGSKIKSEVFSEKTGKKKRFGRLRKAFGLND